MKTSNSFFQISLEIIYVNNCNTNDITADN